MENNIAVDYTIEIDLDEVLCGADNIQEITFEFIHPNSVENTDQNERVIDIDLDELKKENSSIQEISAEINGEDTIIKTFNTNNSKDEIDILQMDEKSLSENPPNLINSISDQVSLDTQIEI